MNQSLKEKTLEELQKIPGVGESISKDLWDLGIRSINDLRRKNPDHLYKTLCKIRGKKIDKCVLYVFRCAVYYASNEVKDTDLLKWWKWKDKTIFTS